MPFLLLHQFLLQAIIHCFLDIPLTWMQCLLHFKVILLIHTIRNTFVIAGTLHLPYYNVIAHCLRIATEIFARMINLTTNANVRWSTIAEMFPNFDDTLVNTISTRLRLIGI